MNTNRLVTSIAGPEIFWFLIYGFAFFLGSQNQPPTYSGSLRLENMSWFVLITAIIISFIPFLWIQENRGWLTFRTGLSGLVGIFFTSTKLCEAIRYNDSRDSRCWNALRDTDHAGNYHAFPWIDRCRVADPVQNSDTACSEMACYHHWCYSDPISHCKTTGRNT